MSKKYNCKKAYVKIIDEVHVDIQNRFEEGDVLQLSRYQEPTHPHGSADDYSGCPDGTVTVLYSVSGWVVRSTGERVWNLPRHKVVFCNAEGVPTE